MYEIGINNAGVYQLVNKNPNYEILVAVYDSSGGIAGVYKNMPDAAVDIPLYKMIGVNPETFEEEFDEEPNYNTVMTPVTPNFPPA